MGAIYVRLSESKKCNRRIDMRRIFLKHFVAAVAALAALATLATALFNLDGIKECGACGAFWAILVVLISFGYACWQTRSKKKINLDLSSELKLTIFEGDLFEQKGIICIPFNEYFDTHVGDGVVGPNTLHGLFINRFYKDRIEDLNEKINKKLSCIQEKDTHPRRFKGCPEKRYELGTCIDIREGENTYVLFALTHFDDNDKANVGRAEYTKVAQKLMQYLSDNAEDKPVYMPLFGTGLSRMRRTGQRILHHLVDTLDFNDDCTIPGGVHIVIKSLDSMNVNLTALEEIVKNGITKHD